jgi:hypothetical protein
LFFFFVCCETKETRTLLLFRKMETSPS